MLSRTAETLYWTARYLERADTLARNLEAAYRMSLMPTSSAVAGTEWESVLKTRNLFEQFKEEFSDINQQNIEAFLIYSDQNPASIKSCIKAARNNAREVRTALTSDVWSAMNQMYIEFNAGCANPDYVELPVLCDAIKLQSAAVIGSFMNTQLRNLGYDFFNLGLYLERADNTARLLDTKYYVLLPTREHVGSGVDRYQWTTLLRAMSSYRSYYWSYSDDYSAENITDFFVLNLSCPRSIHHCVEQIGLFLKSLSGAHGQYNDAHITAINLEEELASTRANEIIEQGLHEFLAEFISDTHRLNDSIAKSFLFSSH